MVAVAEPVSVPFVGYETLLFGIKPEGLDPPVRETIIDEVIVKNELMLVDKDEKQWPLNLIEELCQHVSEYPFFGPYTQRLHSVPLPYFVLRGPGAIARVRAILGNTYPEKADPSTIRGRFGTPGKTDEGVVLNIAHSSDTIRSGIMEPAIMFGLDPSILTWLFTQNVCDTFGFDADQHNWIGQTLDAMVYGTEDPPSKGQLLRLIFGCAEIEQNREARLWVIASLNGTLAACKRNIKLAA